MIQSAANSKVKYVRRLQAEARFRRREQAFVVEGTRWVAELVGEPAPHHLFCTAAWLAKPPHQQLLTQWGQEPTLVSDEVMRHMADTETPAGVLAVLPHPKHNIPAHPQLLLVLDAVQDPGNLGTIIRTAVAANASALLLAPHCVDPFNPKVVRSSMGALLRLPIAQQTWAEIETTAAPNPIYLAAGEAQTSYTAVNWTTPSTLIIGNEAHGAGTQARALNHTPIRIPLYNNIESLNAAVATSVILFEANRQIASPHHLMSM